MGTTWTTAAGRLAMTGAVAIVTVWASIAASGGRRTQDWGGLGLLLLASLAVAAAGRYPRWAYWVSLACVAAYLARGYGIQAPFFLPVIFTAYSVGHASRRLEAAAYAGAAVVAITVAPVVGGDPQVYLLAVVIAISIGVGLVTGESRAATAAREEIARRRQSEMLLTEERLKIARELHDVVSHSIAMMGVQAGAAAHVIEREPEKAKQAMLAIKAASREALQDLRGILDLLREAEPHDPEQPAAGLARLPELLESTRRAGLNIELQTSGMPRTLTPATDLAAYRIVQEALTNILRHAPGSKADLSVRFSDDRLEIEIRNGPGRSGERSRGAGQGLIGMRERATAVGGALNAEATEDGGFAVAASLPLGGHER